MTAVIKSGVVTADQDSKTVEKTNPNQIAFMTPNVDEDGRTLPSYEILKLGMHYFCLRIGTVLKDSLQKISQQLLQSAPDIRTRNLTERRRNLRGLNDNSMNGYSIGEISPRTEILDNSFENIKGQSFDNLENENHFYISAISASSSVIDENNTDNDNNNNNSNNNDNNNNNNNNIINTIERDEERLDDVSPAISNLVEMIENEVNDDRANILSDVDHEKAVNDYDDFLVFTSNFSSQSQYSSPSQSQSQSQPYSIIFSEPENEKVESNDIDMVADHQIAENQNIENSIIVSENNVNRRKLVFENERTTFVPNEDENEIPKEYVDSETRPRNFAPRLYVTETGLIPLLTVPKNIPPKKIILKSDVPKKIDTDIVVDLGSTIPKIYNTVEKSIASQEMINKNEKKEEIKIEKEIIFDVQKVREIGSNNDNKIKIENMHEKNENKLETVKLDVEHKAETEVEAKVEAKVEANVEKKVEKAEEIQQVEKITKSNLLKNRLIESDLPTLVVNMDLDQNPKITKSPENLSKLSEIRNKQRILKKKKSQVRDRNLSKSTNLNFIDESVLIDEIHEEDLKNNSTTIDNALKLEMTENSENSIKIPEYLENSKIPKISNKKNIPISQKSKKSVKIKKIKDLRIRDSVVTERGLSSANEKIKELLV